MSYEKYLKYKSKYLNLKAQIHNNRLINQSGGADSDVSLQSLGSSPASNFSQNGGENQASSEIDNLPLKLTDTPISSESKPELNINKLNNNEDLYGGKKLVRKDRDEFSESEYDTTESSLLSFSSVESSDSDDV
jgi:hypothetical protein